MKIELHEISVAEIANGYEDNAEAGVVGYNGKLNIRPPYQREFVYDEKKRNAVIETINKGFPLNVMYWCKNEDGTFEVLDGQQRTISFCQYVNNDFTLNSKLFGGITETERKAILDYKCMVYFCEGNDKEKLDWFETINIAGERLTPQELRNAVYTGIWLADAKIKFSKSNSAAYLLAKDYVNGSPIRQEFLQTAIEWITGSSKEENIRTYMAQNQHKPNANELFTFFKNVIDWVKLTFPVYRKEMKGQNWAELYKKFKDTVLDVKKLEEQIQVLMIDDDVTNKRGIYPYILTGDEKNLNIRVFSASEKRKMYEKQKGICKYCKKHFEIEEMEADHIVPWSKGGKTELSNGQMLCRKCNNEKSDK